MAAFTIDRVGRRLLQIIGFVGVEMFFALVWAIPGVSGELIPFILLFGATYFFSQFGPNTTTFVYPSEIFPVDARTTGNGIAAGVAKIGAFAGALFTLMLPEPSRATLEGPEDGLICTYIVIC
ncbi:MAG: MFS transporter [Solirubrobacteraceae bacterium]